MIWKDKKDQDITIGDIVIVPYAKKPSGNYVCRIRKSYKILDIVVSWVEWADVGAVPSHEGWASSTVLLKVPKECTTYEEIKLYAALADMPLKEV